MGQPTLARLEPLAQQPSHAAPNIPTLRGIRIESEPPHHAVPAVRDVEVRELLVSWRRGREAEAGKRRRDEVHGERGGGVVGREVVEERDPFEDRPCA